MKEESYGRVKLNILDPTESDALLPPLTGSDNWTEEEGRLLLQAVEKAPQGPYNYMPQAAGHPTPTFLYHLADRRKNLVRGLELKKDWNVLEIGSGCGALTGSLAALVESGSVTCLETSLSQSRICARRLEKEGAENVRIFCGQVGEMLGVLYSESREYDCIILVDSFANAVSMWAQGRGFPGKKYAREITFLEQLVGCCKSRGKIILAAPNRTGIRYFAGWPAEGSGKAYTGLEGYQDSSDGKSSEGKSSEGKPSNGKLFENPASFSASYSRQEWKAILSDRRLTSVKFFYPYPDERYPLQIFSDSCLPHMESLNDTEENLAPCSLNFDENKVLRSLSDPALFRDFSNAFLIIAENDGHGFISEDQFSRDESEPANGKLARLKQRIEEVPKEKKDPIYLKFSTERSPEFSVFTGIRQNGDQKEVYKKAALPQARRHLLRLSEEERRLTDLYRDSGLSVNACTLEKDGKGSLSEVELEYVEGDTFEDLLDQTLAREGSGQAFESLKEYLNLVLPVAKQIPFRETESFGHVFGKIPEDLKRAATEWKSLPVSDIDLIMPNLILTEKGKVLLDYEWTFTFPVPVKYLIFRILFYYFQNHSKLENADFSRSKAFAQYGISQREQEVFLAMEISFQHYIEGSQIPLRNVRIRTEAVNSPIQADVQAGNGDSGILHTLKQKLKRR